MQAALTAYESQSRWPLLQEDLAPELVTAARPLLALCSGVDVSEMFALLDSIGGALTRSGRRGSIRESLERAKAREIVYLAEEISALLRDVARIDAERRVGHIEPTRLALLRSDGEGAAAELGLTANAPSLERSIEVGLMSEIAVARMALAGSK